MKIVSKHFFSELLDADTAEHLLSSKALINSENIRFGTTEGGKVGDFESIPGNTSMASGGIIPDDSATIGGAASEDGRYLAWFNYGSAGNHNIIFYDIATSETLLVMEDADVEGGLGFSQNSRINRAEIVGGNLYWRDGLSEPRHINLGAMLRAKNPTYAGALYDDFSYASSSEYHDITLIKKPPTLAMTIAKITDAGFLNNFISTESYKFSMRYLYYTGEKTVFGPWSDASFLNEADDDSNAIRVTANITDNVPTLAKIVQLVAWVGTSNVGYVIKEWDRSNDADAVDISNHNTGVAALSYDYYGNLQGEPVTLAEMLRPFDNVPVLAGAIAVGKDRLFLGDCTVGYDTPAQTSFSLSLGASTSMTSGDSGLRIFRPSSQRQAGIVYYDRFLRKCGVSFNPSNKVDIPPRNFNFTNAYTALNWDVSNASASSEIPDWAYYYAPLLSRDLKANFFISGFDNLTRYATKDNDGIYVYTNYTYVDGDTVAIALNTNHFIESGIGYSFSEGDVCILTELSGGTYTLPVIGVDGNYILLKAKDIGPLAVLGIQVQFFMAQIYSPHKQAENEPFFEVGQIYKVSNPGTGSRSYSTTTGTFSGDTFVIYRSFAQNTFGEAMCPNDLYFDRWDTPQGRINLVTALGQVRRENSIFSSNVYIPGTAVNGLSTFESLAKDLPLAIGAITGLILASKVQEEGSVMLAIGSGGETASLYLGEQEFFDASGSRSLVKTDDVIGQVNILKGSKGCINQESIFGHKGLVMWYDAFSNSFVQYGKDGLNPISDYKLKRATLQFSIDYLALTSGSPSAVGYVIGGIDPYNDEYLASVPQTTDEPPEGYIEDISWASAGGPNDTLPYPYDYYDGRAKTWCFKIDQNKWQGSFRYNTEFFLCAGDQLYSFSNGAPYLHGVGANNTFYGVYSPSFIAFVCNGIESDVGVSKIKGWLGLSVEGSNAPVFTHCRTETPNIQSSDLREDDFTTKEGVFYAPIYRDRLSPNVDAVGGYDEVLYKGDRLVGPWLKVYMVFDSGSSLLQIKFVNVIYKRSLGHQNI